MMYPTDGIIAETDAHMMQFTQPLNKSAKEYIEALRKKELRCNRLYDVYLL